MKHLLTLLLAAASLMAVAVGASMTSSGLAFAQAGAQTSSASTHAG